MKGPSGILNKQKPRKSAVTSCMEHMHIHFTSQLDPFGNKDQSALLSVSRSIASEQPSSLTMTPCVRLAISYFQHVFSKTCQGYFIILKGLSCQTLPTIILFGLLINDFQ